MVKNANIVAKLSPWISIMFCLTASPNPTAKIVVTDVPIDAKLSSLWYSADPKKQNPIKMIITPMLNWQILLIDAAIVKLSIPVSIFLLATV